MFFFNHYSPNLNPSTLLNLFTHSQSSSVSCEFHHLSIIVALSVIAVMVGSVFRLICHKARRLLGHKFCASPVVGVAGDSPEFDALAILNDHVWNKTISELIPKSDVTSSEDLQIQEVFFASLRTFRMENEASSSTIQSAPTSKTTLTNTTKEARIPSNTFCEICMEHVEIWQMFVNTTCSHCFCYECTSKHIITKIQSGVSIVTCPGVNCKAALDSSACRWIIPEDILIRWDEFTCKSLIQESDKVYCPFNDCLAMLVNDSSRVVMETKCPVCKRTFCAQCNVPWHSEFTCREFVKLNGKKKRGLDEMVEKLAKKKKWRKCPKCKFYVEKNQGCLHITCRCSYEFCYRCGSKWGAKHGSCTARRTCFYL